VNSILTADPVGVLLAVEDAREKRCDESWDERQRTAHRDVAHHISLGQNDCDGSRRGALHLTFHRVRFS